MNFSLSKFVEQKMVQMLTGHVFFRLNTGAHHIASVLQKTTKANYGALLRLMLLEITLRTNGETVTVTVEKVINSFVSLSLCFCLYF